MARSELGTKRVCPTTGRKFYDMNRDPVVSPYTGEELPRAVLELPGKSVPASRARPAVVEEEEESDAVPAGPEIISLEDVAAGEDAEAAVEDDAVIETEEATDDAFLEEEEEAGDDVADLIDGDIEDEEDS